MALRQADEALAVYARNGWHESEEVVRQLRLAVAADLRDIRAHWILGLCLYDVGRYREAVGAFEWVTTAARRDSSVRLLHHWSRIWVGHAYDALGQRSLALAIYREMARTGRTSTRRRHMLRRPVLALGLLAVCLGGTGAVVHRQQSSVEVPEILAFPNANSRPTYFTIHNVREAWEISKGAGVKVGILDHSFGFRTHEGLYAGGENFQAGEWGQSFDTTSHHGFWMASTLREVAPDVQIYALGTYSSDENAKVDAMVRAIDWAIAHRLDVLTYSANRFSASNRPRLDSAVDRALAHGIVTTFIHYPHPGNLLPTWLGPRGGDDEREPDLNILHYDYSVVFTRRYADWLRRGRESRYVPFLSMSSTSPVTAAFVAMLKSVSLDLGPADIKRILMETSRPMTFEGERAERVVDIAAALRSVRR